MSDHDDDLSGFRDDPVFHALTGPPSARELSGEAEMLAAFRAATPARSRRRALGRLGVGGMTLGVAVALSGGVAAAYTASLPAPVQQFAHDITTWLGPVKVPAAHHKPSHHTRVAGPSPSLLSSSPQPLPLAATSAPAPQPAHPKPTASRKRGSRPAAKPKPTPTPTPTVSPKPAVTPAASSAPTSSATPTPTQTATPQAGSITISLSNTTAAPGSTVTAYGRLATSTGDPVPNQEVWLLEHEPGQTSVSEVDSGTTGADGSVALHTAALTHNVRLRLITRGKARSAWIAVIVQPTVTASVSSAGSSSTIHISTDGAEPGDMVDIQRHDPGGWQDVAANQVDSNGAATFGVATPPQRPDHYRAILYRTSDHGYASTRFVVPPQ